MWDVKNQTFFYQNHVYVKALKLYSLISKTLSKFWPIGKQHALLGTLCCWIFVSLTLTKHLILYLHSTNNISY